MGFKFFLTLLLWFFFSWSRVFLSSSALPFLGPIPPGGPAYQLLHLLAGQEIGTLPGSRILSLVSCPHPGLFSSLLIFQKLSSITVIDRIIVP
jgi:hypothetical protein